MIEGMTEQEAIEAVKEAFELSDDDARFYVAVARGDIDGDLVEVQPGEPLPE